MKPRRPESPSSARQSFLPQTVNEFATGFHTPFAFTGAGRRRGSALSAAAQERRTEAAITADLLLLGGLRDDEIHAAIDGDTMLDLATCGALRTYLGRPRRGWHGFADEAHRQKTQYGREYAAFCGQHGIAKAIQVVVRPPVSVVPINDLRTVHAQDSKRLGEKLRYGRKRIAPNLACDIVSAEVRALAPHGSEVDLHFHLAVRGTLEDCMEIRRYFQAANWSWWDSLSGGSQETERYPGALAQYQSKGLAEAIRRASSSGAAFSPANLAELHRQTRRVAMTRATGSFRSWKGQLARDGMIVVEGDDGRISVRERRRLHTLARGRDQLFTSSGARLLRLALHDFGDGLMRPAIRVRGREDITFAEVAVTFDVIDAIEAARQALSMGNTAIPESSLRHRPQGLEHGQPRPPPDTPRHLQGDDGVPW